MVREVLRECELLVRSGQVNLVGPRLREVKWADVPDLDCMAAARICRRVGLITMGLRILSPLINERLTVLSSDEKAKVQAEYAVLLQRSSVLGESFGILKKVDRALAPEADLYLAFGMFQIWDYEAAKVPLHNYLRNVEAGYQKLIGKVNLAATFVNTEGDKEAEILLDEILAEAEAGSAHRLKANALEMKAEVYIRTHRETQAHAALNQAHDILGTARIHDQLFIRQWQSFLKARSTGSLDPLLLFQNEARERRDWESLRESDFLCLLVQNSLDRREQLYFGSPLEAYRSRICRRLNCEPLKFSPVFGEGRLLDLEEGTWDGKSLDAKDLQMLHLLLKDAYRPIPIGALFSELHSGEIYVPEHSPTRLHQNLRRFRNRLSELELPLLLESTKQGYVLHPQTGIALRRKSDLSVISVSTHSIKHLLYRWPEDRSFDRRDLEEHLGIGKTQALKLIHEALNEGLITKNEGRGKAQRYLKSKAV